jgi:lactoylglutathione lyase
MVIPIGGLFEAHLNVSDLQRSVDFYAGILGLTLAATFPERRVAFVWVGSPGQAMIGLWEVGSSPQRAVSHLALSVALNDMLTAAEQLRRAGLAPMDFNGKPTDQPVVLAWMPAASLYFHDPDNNLLEFIAMLSEPAKPDLGVLSWADWLGAGGIAEPAISGLTAGS